MPTAAQIRALMADPQRVLRIVGGVAVARSARCFIEQQAPDGTPWPARYPNQTGDFLNIAGAIEDLRSGTRIKARRYQNRPAGRDTGDLAGRVNYEVAGNSLHVGSDVPYADRFHYGGQSTQAISAIVRDNLRQMLRRKRRSRRRSGQGGRSVEEMRLGPLFRAQTWTTDSPARPFVGLSRQDMTDLQQLLADAAGRMQLHG